ncbi:dTMP kinase [Candidatus Pacearchaeota archaeon]|nr:dTMP kinase [Candidatus Pacearchaeota archaeon]
MEFKRGHPYRGILVTFDGRDGCGKSTQHKKFIEYLEKNSYHVISAWEPGGTEVGEKIRTLLLDNSIKKMSSTTEFLLFEASRAQLVDEFIRPALQQGRIVALDRFYDSTTAYQGAAGKLPLDLVLYGNRVASEGISPDRTYILDVDSETAHTRLGTTADRMESKSLDYHERVRLAFKGIAELEPERIKLLDASKSPEELHHEIISDFEFLIKNLGYKKLKTPYSL